MLRSLRHIVNTKVIGVTLVIVFLSLLSLGLFHMSSGMDMTGNTSGCPFMVHGEVLCSMDAIGHIGAWQATFLAVVPTLSLLMLAVLGAVILCTIAPHLLIKPGSRLLLLYRYFITRIYTFSRVMLSTSTAICKTAK